MRDEEKKEEKMWTKIEKEKRERYGEMLRAVVPEKTACRAKRRQIFRRAWRRCGEWGTFEDAA